MRQDYSLNNMLGMLKEENQFLRSRMRYNAQDIIINYMKKSVVGRQWSAWNWNYPFYSINKLNQLSTPRAIETRFFYDRFTKDTFLPAGHNLKPYDKSKWRGIIKTTIIGRKKRVIWSQKTLLWWCMYFGWIRVRLIMTSFEGVHRLHTWLLVFGLFFGKTEIIMFLG